MCAIGIVTGEHSRAQKGEDLSKGRVAGNPGVMRRKACGISCHMHV
jgi:hypothetical protein